MKPSMSELVRILRTELGSAAAGARYAERIAAASGQDAAAYREATRVLALEATRAQTLED